jgi:hypothetical protein
MEVLREIHLVIAFLAGLCALIFSWNAMGRRVVNAVVALQFLVGLALAGWMGAARLPLPPAIWVHLGIAVLVLAAYGVAIGAGRRTGGRTRALIFSVVGLVLILLNIWFGYHIYMTGGV